MIEKHVSQAKLYEQRIQELPEPIQTCSEGQPAQTPEATLVHLQLESPLKLGGRQTPILFLSKGEAEA